MFPMMSEHHLKDILWSMVGSFLDYFCNMGLYFAMSSSTSAIYYGKLFSVNYYINGCNSYVLLSFISMVMILVCYAYHASLHDKRFPNE